MDFFLGPKFASLALQQILKWGRGEKGNLTSLDCSDRRHGNSSTKVLGSTYHQAGPSSRLLKLQRYAKLPCQPEWELLTYYDYDWTQARDYEKS